MKFSTAGQSKKITGLRNTIIFPELVAATSSAPAVYGTPIHLTGTQKLSIKPKYGSEDEKYDDKTETVKTFENSELTLELRELSTDLRPLFEGGSYNKDTGVYTWSSDNTPSPIGLTFVTPMKNGKYLGHRYYHAIPGEFEQSFETSKSTSASLTFTVSASDYKHLVYEASDIMVTDSDIFVTDLAWEDKSTANLSLAGLTETTATPFEIAVTNAKTVNGTVAAGAFVVYASVIAANGVETELSVSDVTLTAGAGTISVIVPTIGPYTLNVKMKDIAKTLESSIIVTA